MMNRLENKLETLKITRKKALSVFLTAGYPSLEMTRKLVLELEKTGVDFFEIGFPFSDPIADGPVIQNSTQKALDRGMNWNKLLSLAESIREKSQVPLVLMSYANPLFTRGWKKSAVQIAKAGFDGVIIPDMIPEESREVGRILNRERCCLIHLCAPTSPISRMKMLSQQSSGFIYCVSVTGVTGTRKHLPFQEIRTFLNQVKKTSAIPVFLGFGISKPEQLDEFRHNADGFIIGSALIKLLEGKNSSQSLIRKAKNFMIGFSRKLDHSAPKK